MDNLLGSRWFKLGAPQFALGAVVAAVIVFLALSGDSSESSAADRVMLAAGSSTGGGGAPTQATKAYTEDLLEKDLPLSAPEAVAAGWTDPALCQSGRGRFFYKDPNVDTTSYMLMYDNQDELIGVYLYSDSEMPHDPWLRMENLLVGGRPVIGYEHWGMFVYFQDPIRACTSEGNQGNVRNYNTGSAARSAPTPIVPPTPTPTAAGVVEAAAATMSALTSLSITFTSEPEGLAFAEDILPGNIVGILEALEDPVESTNRWIDNVPHRGISGTVRGESLRGLVATAAADVAVKLTL